MQTMTKTQLLGHTLVFEA